MENLLKGRASNAVVWAAFLAFVAHTFNLVHLPCCGCSCCDMASALGRVTLCVHEQNCPLFTASHSSSCRSHVHVSSLRGYDKDSKDCCHVVCSLRYSAPDYRDFGKYLAYVSSERFCATVCRAVCACEDVVAERLCRIGLALYLRLGVFLN